MILLFLILILIGYRLSTPYDGVQLIPGEWVFSATGVEVTAPGNPNIQRGDQVIAINGRKMTSWAETLLQPQPLRPQWQVGQIVTYTIVRGGQQFDIPIPLMHYSLRNLLSQNWARSFALALFAVISIFLLIRRPGVRSVRILYLWMSYFVETIALSGIGIQVSDLATGMAFWLQHLAQHLTLLLAISGLLHFSLIFPSKQTLIRQNRWIVPCIYLAPLVLYGLLGILAWSRSSNILEWLAHWIQTFDLLTAFILYSVVGCLLNTYRLMRQRSPSREGIRLVIIALCLCVTTFMILILAHFTTAGGLYTENSVVYMFLTFGLVMPVALFVAVVRYRLFRIQLILNRTLVYTSLSLIIIGLYILIVGILSQLFNAAGNFIISLIATGVIAIIAPLLRQRLQRAINRLMYGDRDDPYTVLSNLGKRLAATLAPDAMFPILVETIAQSLKLPYAAIALQQDATFTIIASYGTVQTDTVALPIQYQGEAVGQLLAATRSLGESFSMADRRLLTSLAQQAGVAAHTSQLTSALQHSRERLVTTREEERLRLRRDLHDGVGPALAGIMLKLGVVRKRLTIDPMAADSLLLETTADIENIIADVRRLTQELRPSALDEFGLLGSLRRYILQLNATCGIQITFEPPASLFDLSAATEVAIYRLTTEAVTNVIRHSQAKHCHICLTATDVLTVDIRDDGRGLAPEHRSGVGLHSMRERAEELGGVFRIDSEPEHGTHIQARFPLPTDAQSAA
jgi:signal transduction histidine kinase